VPITSMNLATVDDVIYLALTFILAAVLTVTMLIWGRTTSPQR
jgi:hypothetical protein